MKSVSLRVIASKLGYSRSTVSFALRNKPCIAQKTRIKIQTLAKRLGWKPNAELARHLALVRSTREQDHSNLALIMNKPKLDLLEEHGPREHLDGALQRAADLGYRLEVFNLAEKPLSPARLLGILRARGVQGVVFLATTGPGTSLKQSYLGIGEHFASAVLGIRYPEPPYHVAIVDLLSAGHMVIEKLLKEGFKRPGAVLPRGLDSSLAWGFSGGIHSGCMELPPEDRVPICHVGTDETHLPEYSFPAIAAWIRQEKPDVLVTTDTKFLRRFLDQIGSPINELKICTLSHTPGITQEFGIDQRDKEVGAAAVDLIIGQLHRGERGIPAVQRTVQIEGGWVGPSPATTKRRRLPGKKSVFND